MTRFAIASALSLAIAGCGSSPADAEDPEFTPASGDAGLPLESGTPEPTDAATTEDGAPPADAGGLAVGCAFRATTNVNLREGPSTSTAILHVIPSGDTAILVDVTPQAGFYNVKHGGQTGWAFGDYLDKSCTTPDASIADAPMGTATIADIDALALGSSCAKYSWKDRGTAPKGYIKGVAETFARAVCQPMRSDVVLVSKKKTTDDVHDALSWYNSNFAALGMSNDVAGVVTMRHVYTLLIGLGMRESSGEHCCGRDTTATNTSSSAAEAGAWQTSYDSHSYSSELDKRFALYRTSSPKCLLEAFKDGVSCSTTDWEIWGTGTDGRDFQKISKECPVFSAEYAAMMLRLSGGSVGHYGPLRRKDAELRPECDQMLQKVQTLVESSPGVCALL
jgi:hypothetical protein